MSHDRPDFDQYYINLCFDVALRSEDPNTKHGAIIVDQHYRIVGTGYNAFASGADDDEFPLAREAPDPINTKYYHVRHSELNAILNCIVSPRSLIDTTIYISAKPCLSCLYDIWDVRIKKIVSADIGYHFQNYEKENDRFEAFIAKRGIEWRLVKPELKWIQAAENNLRRIGYIK